MMEISKIKLVIWDLDETFWKGTLSDGYAQIIEENVQLVIDMVNAGVVCSICSKNDYDKVKEFLSLSNIWEQFVFVSINWSPKGERVSEIIKEMQLREENVLFIDDNATNLAEVSYCCPKIMCQNIDVIPKLIQYFTEVKKMDLNHDRLSQYRVLEKKQNFKTSIASNEEFLRKCDICVNIYDDCISHIDRIEDLVMRSNQLNFTKLRSNSQELLLLLQDPTVKSGYVEVNDSFGDYGIVGFFAIKNNECVHFVFSCRTLNMGVEQYVYHKLNSPELVVVGEVSSILEEKCPDWINQTNEKNMGSNEKKDICEKLVIKGPCDMSQIFSYIKESSNIIKEFTYIGRNGVSIEGRNHTMHMVECLTLSESIKKKVIDELPFGDNEMFSTAIYDDDIAYVFFSLFTDPNLGLYREKKSGAIVAFGEYCDNITDKSIWDDLINKKLFVANCSFNKINLELIRRKYEYIGRITPYQILENLKFMYEHMNNNVILILNLGSESAYMNNTKKAYEGRERYNKELNDLVRKWAAENNRIRLIDINNYITGQESFINNINHFNKKIYFEMSGDLLKIINENGRNNYKQHSMRTEAFVSIIRKIKKIPTKLRRMFYKS